MTPPKRPVPSTPDERLSRITNSSFADTLRALAGQPSAYAVDPTTSPDVLGRYRGKPGADTIALTYALLYGRRNPPGAPVSPNAAMRREQPEYVLAHETGHKRRDDPAARSMVRQQDSVYATNLPTRSHGEYWRQNEDEHFAEAFANAITLLRATAGERGDPDAVSRIAPTAARYERGVPGTNAMAQELLATPIYANHPLNRARAVPAAQADMTAARPSAAPVPVTGLSFDDMLQAAMQSRRVK